MSELIDNVNKRKQLLKHMILQLHEGIAPEAVRTQLVRLLGQIPYNDVVDVEQQLIAEGLPQEEVLQLCDVHTAALKGTIDQTGAKIAPVGHPVHTFLQENAALRKEIQSIKNIFEEMNKTKKLDDYLKQIQQHFLALSDVEKHYQRKENLLFPYLEKKDITGPPTVMWGKHDETREFITAALEALKASVQSSAIDEVESVIELVLNPALNAIDEMIEKEQQILFPMCMDKLNDQEWYEIYKQSVEIGFCLFDPIDPWQPEGMEISQENIDQAGRIQLPSGSMTVNELTALLNTIPFDLTFVDKNDKVRYFTQGKERIFARNRAILGRDVQRCHPPSSVHIVEQILNDFKSARQDSAAFWIQMQGKFIHIEYYALRNEKGDYLGTLEVSQDLTEKRKLEGEQRLLSYSK